MFKKIGKENRPKKKKKLSNSMENVMATNTTLAVSVNSR